MFVLCKYAGEHNSSDTVPVRRILMNSYLSGCLSYFYLLHVFITSSFLSVSSPFLSSLLSTPAPHLLSSDPPPSLTLSSQTLSHPPSLPLIISPLPPSLPPFPTSLFAYFSHRLNVSCTALPTLHLLGYLLLLASYFSLIFLSSI